MDDIFWDFFGPLLIAGALVAACVGIAIWLESASCHSRWQQSGYETQYGPLQGCLVKYNGRWIPDKMLRQFQD